MRREVPFFNYGFLFREKEAEFTQILLDTCRKGAFIMQQEMRDFEKNLATFVGAKHAFGVADGTEAIIIALRASGIGPGHEVIVPSHTFIASVASIQLVGATAVLADIGPDHMMDPEHVATLVTSKTKAILPVQLNGRTCDMDRLGAIAKEHGLLIIEDAAQAVGSKFNGKCAGTFGSAGTYSFYPAKTLGSFGDAGGIVTNDDEVAERIYRLRDHGRGSDGEIVEWGYNSRLDNLQAAILNFKLKTYPQDLERRRALAGLYHEELGGLSALHLPPPPLPGSAHYDIYQNYEIEADRRDELQKYLKENGVGTLVQWSGKAVHQWKKLGFSVNLPKTDKMFERCVMLPMNTSLSNEDVGYVCQLIKTFYKK